MRLCLQRLARLLEMVMLISGAACLASVFSTWQQSTFAQIAARGQLRGIIAAARSDRPELARNSGSLHALSNPVVAWLDVPRLGVSVGVLEGDSEPTLRLAAGHLPDTPMPWNDGNAAIAGHRDTFFRALRELRVGDGLSLATGRGIYNYRVVRTRVVMPEDLSVLDPADGVALTLITCYPFNYLGLAPQRYIVQAIRMPERAR
jgi:LPXTG-site transpeptidase (sortase) family protein